MKSIDSIQALRALAALSVVACHYEFFYPFTQSPDARLAFGEAGVDLFFVISGFIMVYASQPLYAQRGATVTFIRRRLVRIVPLYWLFTTVYLAAAFAMPVLGKDISADFVIASYLFFPLARSDGTMQPLLGQGWSLNYEVLFYAIFAMTLFAPRLWAVIIASAAVCGFAVAGYLFHFESPALKFWTFEIVVEFAFGMMIGLAYLEGLRLRPWQGWLLFAFGFLFFLGSPETHVLFGGRLVPWGVPAAVMVTGAALGDLSWRGLSWRWLLLVGEASYSLYLSHAVVIRGLLVLLKRQSWMLPFWIGFIVSSILCVAVALAIYYMVELPLNRLLRSRFAARPSNILSIKAGPLTRQS